MGLFQKSIICEATTRSLLQTVNSPGTTNFGAVVQGDNINLRIAACIPTGSQSAPFAYVDLSNCAINVAFGTPGGAPINVTALASNAGNVGLPTITITETQAGVNGNASTNRNSIQTIAISNLATGGTFGLASGGEGSNAINFGAEASEVSSALLNAATNLNFSATKTNDFFYTLTAQGAQSNQPLSILGIDSNALLPAAKQLNIPLTNNAFATLLNGATSATTYIEIEAISDSDHTTLCLEQIVVLNDLIN